MNDSQLKASQAYAEFNKIDPTAVAERVIGDGSAGSYKSFDDKQQLAMLGLHMLYNNHKEALLKAAGDTTFSMGEADYLATVLALGFEIVYTEDVKYIREGYGKPDQEREETYYLMAHRGLGIVLQWDTYTWEREDGTVERTRNGGELYAMWKPNDPSQRHFSILASGGWDSLAHPDWRHNPEFDDKSPDDLIWVGNWDCREGIKTKLRQLLEAGTTLPQWPSTVRRPFGIFQSHFDYYSAEYLAMKAQGGLAGFKVSARIKEEREAHIRGLESSKWIFDIIGNNSEEQ